jgi:hypothetical protein
VSASGAAGVVLFEVRRVSYPVECLPGPVSPCCGAVLFERLFTTALCGRCFGPVDLRRLEWRLMEHFSLGDRVK